VITEVYLGGFCSILSKETPAFAGFEAAMNSVVGMREIWLAALRTRTHSVLWKKEQLVLQNRPTNIVAELIASVAALGYAALRILNGVGGVRGKTVELPCSPRASDSCLP